MKLHFGPPATDDERLRYRAAPPALGSSLQGGTGKVKDEEFKVDRRCGSM
jgi:hypothetical protein